MGDVFKIELYRVIVSIGIGFIAIFLFIFNFGLYDIYAKKLLIHESSQQEQTQTQSELDSKKKTQEEVVTHQNSQQLSKQAQKERNGEEVGQKQKVPSIELQELKTVLKNTLELIKNYFWVFFFLSIIVGELLSTIGMVIIIELFEKPLDGGIENREVFIDKDVKWIKFKKLFSAFSSASEFLNALSELHFALAKGFAGIYLAFTIASIINTFMFLISGKGPKEIVEAIGYMILSNVLSLIFIVMILFRFFDKPKFCKFNISPWFLFNISWFLFIGFYLFLLIFFVLNSIALGFFSKLTHITINFVGVVHAFYLVFGIFSLIISLYNFRFANQMLYLSYTYNKEKSSS